MLSAGAATSQRIETTKAARLSRRRRATRAQRSLIDRLDNRLISERIFICRRIARIDANKAALK